MSLSGVRRFSTKLLRTPEEIKAAIERAQRFKKFNQPTAKPTTLTMGLPTGKDLYEPEDMSELAHLSGMPAEHANRSVIIAQRWLKTTQQGDKFSNQWQLFWKNSQKWSNPLMGWTSTSDPLSKVKLTFDSVEEAIAFAERNGWKYDVKKKTHKEDPDIDHSKKSQYSHNFLPQRALAQMKEEGPKTKIWEVPTFGESHFVMPLRYHGDGEVTQHGPTKQEA